MAPDDYQETGTIAVTLDGQDYQLPRHCPHRGGRLDYGDVNRARGTITCPLHRSVFCLKTGRHLNGPECGDLTVSRTPASDGRDPR